MKFILFFIFISTYSVCTQYLPQDEFDKLIRISDNYEVKNRMGGTWVGHIFTINVNNFDTVKQICINYFDNLNKEEEIKDWNIVTTFSNPEWTFVFFIRYPVGETKSFTVSVNYRQ